MTVSNSIQLSKKQKQKKTFANQTCHISTQAEIKHNETAVISLEVGGDAAETGSRSIFGPDPLLLSNCDF